MRKNMFDRMFIEQKDRNMQMVERRHQVGLDKVTRRQNQIRLQRDERFDIRMGVSDFRFAQRIGRKIAKLRHPGDEPARLKLIECLGQSDQNDAAAAEYAAFAAQLNHTVANARRAVKRQGVGAVADGPPDRKGPGDSSSRRLAARSGEGED